MNNNTDNAHCFRTPVTVRENRVKIDHTSSILSIGSCFSEHIAQRLKAFLFNPCINPMGILYNPASISHSLQRILTQKKYSEEELFLYEGVWKSFDHHSRFDGSTPEECLQKINNRLSEAIRYMARLDTLIVTLGTAFVYHKKDTGQLVANCHRLPHDTFTRSLLAADDIIAAYTTLLQNLYDQFPAINIIITISPVRHLRDNPHGNQISKAHLLAAVYELEARFPGLYYFPSYEIMMDELRDYRFYDIDMIHPAPLAVEYIWERFLTACISQKAREFITQYRQVLQAKSHAVRGNNREQLRSFVQKQLAYLHTLEEKFPEISFTEDNTYFKSLL